MSALHGLAPLTSLFSREVFAAIVRVLSAVCMGSLDTDGKTRPTVGSRGNGGAGLWLPAGVVCSTNSYAERWIALYQPPAHMQVANFLPRPTFVLSSHIPAPGKQDRLLRTRELKFASINC